MFLNISFFNFVPTPNKSFRFTRFRRSYVNRNAVVPTNHSQSYTAFLLDVRCSRLSYYFFYSCLSPVIMHLPNLFLLSTRVASILLISRWVSRRKDVKYLSINISKRTIGVQYTISSRTTFSPHLHLVEDVCPFCNINRTIFPLHI